MINYNNNFYVIKFITYSLRIITYIQQYFECIWLYCGKLHVLSGLVEL